MQSSVLSELQSTALPCPLLFDLHHEIVSQIQVVVNVLLGTHLLYLLLLFMLWASGPIHGLSSVSRFDILLLLRATLVHHFLLGILGLLPLLDFHASLFLLYLGNGKLILFRDSVTFEGTYLIVKFCIATDLSLDDVELIENVILVPACGGPLEVLNNFVDGLAHLSQTGFAYPLRTILCLSLQMDFLFLSFLNPLINVFFSVQQFGQLFLHVLLKFHLIVF